MLCVENSRLAGIAPKSNVSISRVTGGLDAYELFVDSAPHIDGTACPHSICGMLNSAPRRRLAAGIRIIPSRRYIESGVGLARGSRYAHQEHNKRQKFHACPPKKNTPLAFKHYSL